MAISWQKKELLQIVPGERGKCVEGRIYAKIPPESDKQYLEFEIFVTSKKKDGGFWKRQAFSSFEMKQVAEIAAQLHGHAVNMYREEKLKQQPKKDPIGLSDGELPFSVTNENNEDF